MSGLTSVVDMLGPKTLFVPFMKVDAELRMVWGYASTEKRDQQGEIVKRSAIEDALPAYLRFSNIREMHQPSAVGVAKEANLDDKGLWIGAKVVDDRAWNKVKEGVYKGFSLGGRVIARDPQDRSIINRLEMTEISLVDRPANPEATFEMFKIDGGSLTPRPVQVWYCGDSSHQHFKKGDAEVCMADQADKLAKGTPLSGEMPERGTTTSDKTQLNAYDAGHTAGLAGAAEDQNPAMKGSYDHEAWHRGYHAGSATRRGAEIAMKPAAVVQELAKQATRHEELAKKARGGASHHREVAQQFAANRDEASVTFHKGLATAGDLLAKHHEAEAERYHQLAAQATSAAGQKESSSMTKTVQDATTAAEAAIAKLAEAMSGDDVAKVAIDHAAEAKSAQDAANEHDGIADTHMAHAQMSQAVANGGSDAASEAEREASGHRATAMKHRAVADSYHELSTHHLVHGAMADAGTKEAAEKMLKDLASQHTAFAEKCETAAKGEEKLGTSSLEAFKKIYTDNASLWRTMGAARAKVGKATLDQFTNLAAKPHEDLQGGEAGTVRELPAQEKDVHGIMPLAKLKLDKDGFDKNTGAWFGKREFSDKKRQELADKGHAMPDGSFPIENESDLSNAVQAHGRAKDPAKAKAHITARAKALGATDKLPADWSGSTKESAAKGIVSNQGDGAADESGRQNAGEGAQGASKETPMGEVTEDETGDGMGKAKAMVKCSKCAAMMPKDLAKCSKCGTPMMTKAERHGNMKKALKGDLSKGMSVIALIAQIIAQIESLQQTSAYEQLLEGDSTGLPDAIEAWMKTGIDLLRTAVTEETAEVLGNEDVEVQGMPPMAMCAKMLTEPWTTNIIKAITDHAGDGGLAKSPTLKALVDKLSKLGARHSKADMEHIQKIHDHTASLGALCAAAKAVHSEAGDGVAGERDTAVAALTKMTAVIIPLTREVQAMKKTSKIQGEQLQAAQARIAELEAQPMPSKGRGAGHSGTLRKTQDAGGSDAAGIGGPLGKINELPTGRDRADRLLERAYLPLVGVAAPGGQGR